MVVFESLIVILDLCYGVMIFGLWGFVVMRIGLDTFGVGTMWLDYGVVMVI